MLYPIFLIHLSNSYEGLKNYKKALEFHKLYMEANDSLFNEEKNKQIVEMESKYQAEKKQQEIEKQKILLEKKDIEVKQQEAVASRQRMQRNAFIGGFALMLILAVVVLRSYRQKKKANILLSEQKEEIGQKNEELQQQKEEITVQRDELEQTNEKLDETNKQLELKNKDVTDSINYAKRIQTAILPPEEYVTKSLPEHFILFKPRDIVSGDFYWATVKNNSLIIAAVDCTGHGVPGAFMSMLGVSFLNEIVNKQTLNPYKEMKEEILQANEILNQLRDNVINSLHQTGKADEAQDGMDIALCILNMETNELRYAGANNPLYIIRTVIARSGATKQSNSDKEQSQKIASPDTLCRDRNDGYELIEIKADRMPIGIQIVEKIADLPSFTNHKIKLSKGDTIYMFSDGFVDQFGGPNGKKFKSKQFKQLLVDIQEKNMTEQKAILDKTIEDWKGDLEQIDDILVMGIRI